jgi:hypothetical protein
MRSTLVLCGLVWFSFQLLPGCMTEGYSMKDRVTEAARLYNEGVRWNKIEQAVGYLPKEDQRIFVDRMSALEDELEFGDSDMVELTLDKKHDKATARMTYIWIMKRRGLLEKTTTEQTWVEKDGKWIMKREVRLRGSPLPLWKERSEVADEKAADDEKEVPIYHGATAGGPSPDWHK